ncbi:MAG: hypothetical protein Q8L64_05565 [bacterium]|nr:hypothetical protein [bacterium]
MRHRFVVIFSVTVITIIVVLWATTLVLRIKSGTFIPEERESSSSAAASGIAESWRQFLRDIDGAIGASSEAFGSGQESDLESEQVMTEDATSSTTSDIIDSN